MATPGHPDRIERRLAAILAADIVGYSRLMGANEAATARDLREHRTAIDPIVANHAGRIVKTTGDGALMEFPSIVAAVECAIAMQKLMAERNAAVPSAVATWPLVARVAINLFSSPNVAFGHEPKSAGPRRTSALPPKADLNDPASSDIPNLAAHLGLLVTLLGIRFFASILFFTSGALGLA